MKLTDIEIAKEVEMTADNLRKTYKVKKPKVYNILKLGVICHRLGLTDEELEKVGEFIKSIKQG